MKVIVLDTETTNTLEEPIAYDIGWAVVDLDTGEILKTESYAVAEIFLDKDFMNLAYFAEKIPTYWEDIKNGNRKLARLSTIYFSLRADVQAYRVVDIFAHNAAFDDTALKNTTRYITGSKYRYFLPYGTIVNCTLKMARKAYSKNEAYKKFCKENGFVTARGQAQLTAEVITRYLTKNLDFEEEHQGVDDVLIEKEILLNCLKRGIDFCPLWN